MKGGQLKKVTYQYEIRAQKKQKKSIRDKPDE